MEDKTEEVKPTSTSTTLLSIVCFFANVSCFTSLYLIFYEGPNNWLLKNAYLNFWFAMVLGCMALQGLFFRWYRDFPSRSGGCFPVLQSVYFIATSVLFMEMSIGWDAFGRGDITLWAWTACIVALSNLYAIATNPVSTGSSRRRSHPKRDQPKDPWQPVTEETVLLEPSTTRSDNVYISPDESLLGVKRGSIGRVSEAAPTGRNSKCSRLCLTILVQMVYLTELATLILSFLLLNGASHQIPEFQQFSKIRDGNYLRLVTNHSEDQNIFYRCQGNNTDFSPVILEGDIDKGIGDWLGVLADMSLNNHEDDIFVVPRVCVFDKPGMGHSEYAFPDQLDPINYYRNLLLGLSAAEEDYQAPYTVVTLGNAINFIRQVAADESGEDGAVIIDGIIAIEPLGPNFEHRALSNVTDLPEDEVKRLVDKTAWGATIIADTANGIGVPFGIISSLIPGKNLTLWSANDRLYQNWCHESEKTWTMKRWKVLHKPDDPIQLDLFERTGIATSVLMSKKTDDQVERLICQVLGLSTEDCQVQKGINRFAQDEKLGFVGNGGLVVQCREDECRKDYFIYDNPGFTATAIREIMIKRKHTLKKYPLSP